MLYSESLRFFCFEFFRREVYFFVQSLENTSSLLLRFTAEVPVYPKQPILIVSLISRQRTRNTQHILLLFVCYLSLIFNFASPGFQHGILYSHGDKPVNLRNLHSHSSDRLMSESKRKQCGVNLNLLGSNPDDIRTLPISGVVRFFPGHSVLVCCCWIQPASSVILFVVPRAQYNGNSGIFFYIIYSMCRWVY